RPPGAGAMALAAGPAGRPGRGLRPRPVAPGTVPPGLAREWRGPLRAGPCAAPPGRPHRRPPPPAARPALRLDRRRARPRIQTHPGAGRRRPRRGGGLARIRRGGSPGIATDPGGTRPGVFEEQPAERRLPLVWRVDEVPPGRLAAVLLAR